MLQHSKVYIMAAITCCIVGVHTLLTTGQRFLRQFWKQSEPPLPTECEDLRFFNVIAAVGLKQPAIPRADGQLRSHRHSLLVPLFALLEHQHMLTTVVEDVVHCEVSCDAVLC